jgi:capsular exopolysaccharide synthesis family protein
MQDALHTRLPVAHQGAPVGPTPGVYYVQPSTPFAEFWALLKRRRLLASIIAMVLCSSVVIALLVLPARYRGTAQVMIEARKAEVVKVDPVLGNLPADSETVSSELEVLRSRDLVARLARDLHLEDNPEFDPNAPSLWRSAVQRALDHVSPYLPASFVELGNVLSRHRPIDGQSRTNAVVEDVSRHLEIAQVGRSRVISIAFWSRDRQLASLAANTLAELYVNNQAEIKRQASQQANRWITENLTSLSKAAADAAKRVADFRAANGLIEGRESSLIAQEISEVNSQLTEAKGARIALAAKMENIGGAKADANASSQVLSSPIIQQLRQQQANLASKNAELESTFGRLNPSVQANRAQVADVERRIAAETHKIVASVRHDFEISLKREADLQARLEDLKAQLAQLNTAAVHLRQLQDEANVDQALYDNFLRRSKETGREHSFEPAEAVLISHAAEPRYPFFPDYKTLLPVGLAASLFVTVLVVLALESGDRGFRSQEQIEKVLGIPTAGIVPELKRQTQADQTPEPMSLMGAAMIDIFTRVCLGSAGKCVLIASSLPREGKTLTALFLARVSGMSGRRVLLVDADLRRSGLRRKLRSTGPGLSDLLMHKATLDEVVCSDAAGIDLIPCGSAVENPAGLLLRQEMSDFIAQVRSQYDLILIDSPAIMAGPDASILAKLATDSVLFIRWARTSRQIVNAAFRRLTDGGGNVSGAILARIDLRRISRYSMTDALSYSAAMRKYYPHS